MKIPTILRLVFFGLMLSLTACLTVETKEYTFELKSYNSGTLTITYFNILSQLDDEKDVSEIDFAELTDKYLNGTELEGSYPNASNFRKRLWVQDDKLCGEIKMDFADLEAVKLYKMDNKSPYILNIKGLINSETFLESNGKFAGEEIQLVVWDKKMKVLKLKTQISTPDETHLSMVNAYNNAHK